MQEEQPSAPKEGLLGPRQYGTLMIVIGIVALVFATYQHRRDMKRCESTIKLLL